MQAAEPRLEDRLRAENEDLRRRLAEAEDVLRAIRQGEVDAIVWDGDVVSIPDRLLALAAANRELEQARVVALSQLEDATAARREAEQAVSRLTRLNQCLLGCGADPDQNIQSLVSLLGEHLEADCALYNRFEEGRVVTLGKWHAPPGFSLQEDPEGTTCYEVIRLGDHSAQIFRNLQESDFARTDLNIARYGLRTYVGKAVWLENAPVGVLCAVFQQDRNPSLSDLNLLGILTSAVGAEEKRKRAETALRDSEFRRSLALEAAQMGTWDMDLAAGRVTASERAESMWGFAPGTFLGDLDSVLALIHPEDQPALLRTTDRAAQTRSPFQSEFRLVTADGRARWMCAHGRHIFDAAGKAVRAVGVVFEVTDHKRLEENFRQAQKLEAIGQLAGGVAHDFNNILAAILMQLGLLHMSATLDPDTKQTLRDLEAEARRAATLTRQLLMFSRRSVLDVKALDLNEVVAGLLKMLSRLIGEHIRLAFEAYGGGLPLVRADAGMLEQVLMNLVVNARDAMPRGGSITIRTLVRNLTEEDTGALADRRPGQFVCLVVSDTGAGMTKEVVGHIFEPFFTTKEVGKGTGLGLATVHGIVAQHQGWVEVESAAGQGTTFRVFLPALAEPGRSQTAAAIGPVIRRGRETILLVEDEAHLRRAVSSSLRALGYQVHEAENGRDALRLWEKHGPDVDLLFTDMVMSEGMTGLELAEYLLTLKPTLKVVISSGYSVELAGINLLERAEISYLPKPYEANLLAETLRASLDQTR